MARVDEHLVRAGERGIEARRIVEVALGQRHVGAQGLARLDLVAHQAFEVQPLGRERLDQRAARGSGSSDDDDHDCLLIRSIVS